MQLRDDTPSRCSSLHKCCAWCRFARVSLSVIAFAAGWPLPSLCAPANAQRPAQPPAVATPVPGQQPANAPSKDLLDVQTRVDSLDKRLDNLAIRVDSELRAATTRFDAVGRSTDRAFTVLTVLAVEALHRRRHDSQSSKGN